MNFGVLVDFGKWIPEAAHKATFLPTHGVASRNPVKVNFPEKAIVAIHGTFHLMGQSKAGKENPLWTFGGNLVETLWTFHWSPIK